VIPFGYAAVIGLVLFKNVDRAFKNMNVGEVMRRFFTCEKFIRTFVLASSYQFQIVKTNSMFESECLKLGGNDIGPM